MDDIAIFIISATEDLLLKRHFEIKITSSKKKLSRDSNCIVDVIMQVNLACLWEKLTQLQIYLDLTKKMIFLSVGLGSTSINLYWY